RARAGGGVWVDDHVQEEVVAIAAGAQTRGRNCDPQSSASGFGACTCEVVPLDQQAYRVDRAACPPARWINLFHSWGGRHGPEYSPPAAEAAQHKKEYRPAIRDTKLVHEEKSCAVATHGSASAILLVRGHSVFNQRLYPLVTSPCADDWARIARTGSAPGAFSGATSTTRCTKSAAKIMKNPPATTAASRLLCKRCNMIQPKKREAMISGMVIKK